MGIDARILLRVKRATAPTDKELQRWSWMLCESVGAEHFFIADGMSQLAYAAANAAWHAAFNAHPKYAEMRKMREEDYNESRDAHLAILADIGKSPEQRRRSIELTHVIYPFKDGDYNDVPATHRKPGKAYTQDGEAVLAEAGEWFLEVNVWSRFYGEGYERGDLLTLCAIAEWCEINVPNCEVWYGGDSSGVCVEPWPGDRRYALRKHLYSEKGRDYFNYKSNIWGKGPRPEPCSLCVDKGHFSEFGHGPDWLAVSCAGCGKNFETKDKGATWQVMEKDKLLP